MKWQQDYTMIADKRTAQEIGLTMTDLMQKAKEMAKGYQLKEGNDRE